MANEQVRTIIIKTQVSGDGDVKKVVDGLARLNKTVKESSDVLGYFKNAFDTALGFSVFGIGLRTLTTMSDEMQNLTNRIKIFNDGITSTTDVMEGLFGVAERTKTSITELGTIYTRLAASTTDSKLSAASLLAVTETLQNTFRISGSNAQEAAGASIQFAQALSLGTLRGQELRSVVSQNAYFADLLAKYLGKTRGELIKFAESGGITSTVIFKAMAAGMDEANKKAQQLTVTFEQTLSLAMNKTKKAIGDLNDEFKLSSKFAKGVDEVIKRGELLAYVLGVVITSAIIAKLIPAIGKLAFSLATLTSTNVVLLAITSIATAIAVAHDSMEDFNDSIDKLIDKGRRLGAVWDLVGATFSAINGEVKLTGDDGAIQKYKDQISVLDAVAAAREKEFEASKKQEDIQKKLLSLGETFKKEAEALKDPEVIEKRTELLKRLNLSYEAGTTSIESYYNQLERVDSLAARRDFLQGKKDVEQYNAELNKNRVSEFNRDLQKGLITLTDWRKMIELNNLDTLNEKFRSGKIALQEYDAELVKISEKFQPGSALRTGTDDYLKSIGTLSHGIAGVVTKTFGAMEDALVEFTKKGKVNMADFAQVVLDELNRVIIRAMVIAPLAKGFESFIGGMFSPGADLTATSGPVTSGGYAFASGGVVTSPTNFTFDGYKSGMMGEAGPEAIMPLKRAANGDLGVQAPPANVIVNITNNSGSEVQQTESKGPNGEKQIDILINTKVKEGIASGQYDKTMQQAYGLRRKGN